MDNISLEEVIKNIYDNRVSYIKSINMELEREYFTLNSSKFPFGDIMEGTSYEDHFSYFKETVKKETEYDIEHIFMLLQEYFLFSYGHDLMFKNKLEADLFNCVPMKNFIYPKLEKAIKEKYNDVSVMKENPNLKANLKEIENLVFTYIELSSLLYLLYCHDFQFPKGWEQLCPEMSDKIIDILDKSKITIGEFLNALIDFKCGIMTDILEKIENLEWKKKYLNKVEQLRQEKHELTKTFSDLHLPITYFLKHDFFDFLGKDYEHSSILDDNSEPKEKTIILKP